MRPHRRALALTLVLLPVWYRPLPAQATTAPRVITMGLAERTLRPDRVILRIGVETHAATAGVASSELSRRMGQVQDSPRRFPVPLDSLQVIAYSVGPNYDFREGKKLIDYEASATLQVSLRALDRLGTLVDLALAAGATDIPDMSFQSDSTEAIRRQLLAAALADARADASAIALSGKVALGPLLQVSTLRPGEFLPEAEFGNGFAGGLQLAPGLISGAAPRDVVVRVTVYTTWQLGTRRS